ncbi:hypothetical protein HUJ04_001693 [Dendroctonus ponderosae]|nr:hypothetical protein HUJ04_001693 [Dendroctonus ponderosae]KAH1017321.1 hypothetical protein HUJ05_007979 [Dendroctonus ponderosae]
MSEESDKPKVQVVFFKGTGELTLKFAHSSWSVRRALAKSGLTSDVVAVYLWVLVQVPPIILTKAGELNSYKWFRCKSAHQ